MGFVGRHGFVNLKWPEPGRSLQYLLQYVTLPGSPEARIRILPVSRLLAGHNVGLEEIDQGLFDVYFGPIWLGRFVEPKGLIFDPLGRGKRRTGGTYKGRRTVTHVS